MYVCMYDAIAQSAICFIHIYRSKLSFTQQSVSSSLSQRLGLKMMTTPSRRRRQHALQAAEGGGDSTSSSTTTSPDDIDDNEPLTSSSSSREVDWATGLWPQESRQLLGILASLGFLETSFLTYQKLVVQDLSSLCNVGGMSLRCGDVLNSEWASFLGT